MYTVNHDCYENYIFKMLILEVLALLWKGTLQHDNLHRICLSDYSHFILEHI
jgi:hypothetical protein